MATAMTDIQINRKFGLITGLACIAIFAYQIVFRHKPLIYIAGIGCLLLLTAWVKPVVLNPVRIVWDKIGSVLGVINTHLILFVVFFIIITPLGWLIRLLKKNMIVLKWAKGEGTYWHPVSGHEKSSFKQQF
jgi:hypothetical protein